MKIGFIMLPLAGMFFVSCGIFQRKELRSTQTVSLAESVEKPADSTKKAGKTKPYGEVVTEKALTDSGLLIIHRIEEKYLLEIPNAVLGKDILAVGRIDKAATGIRPSNGFQGYSGDEIGNQVIRFDSGPEDKLFVRTVTYGERAADTTDNGLYLAVRNSNVQPILAAFDVKAYNADSTAFVIDATDYLNGDNALFSFPAVAKKNFKLAGIQADRSFISQVASYPINVEFSTVKTFSSGESGGFATYELNTSMILLPDNPMRVRHSDARIGYFNTQYRDFDKPQEARTSDLVVRWRLEPNPQDVARYLRGELVEPVKPIVFYIDPATPKKWVPYLMQGVNAWREAFEQAGFKNAITAMEAPENDPEWSLYDARHSAIVYKPSFVANASGPNVHDPRTGEIMEAHINWYHNVMQLLRNWYMVQAGPNDPRARQMTFDDELMGTLIQFVCTHEVGHTLGLLHNFGASATVPVEKLRDREWVSEHGICPSIMDYARFNYVAQPEDNMPVDLLLPKIGAYDKWAIEWGYRWFPSFASKEDEQTYLNQWVIETVNQNRQLWFGMQFPFGTVDPRCQSEDLGDNAMKAGSYGIRNLRRVMENLPKWTKTPNEGYGDLHQMHAQVIAQYQRYINHVVYNIYLPDMDWKTVEETGYLIRYPSRRQIKEAVGFLHRELFDTPDWLITPEIFSMVRGGAITEPLKIQTATLGKLLSPQTYNDLNIGGASGVHPTDYDFNDLLRELSAGIWKELANRKPVDLPRRNLQLAYVTQLTSAAGGKGGTAFTGIARQHIRELQDRVSRALPQYGDADTKIHLAYVRDLLKESLEAKPVAAAADDKPKIGFAHGSYLDLWQKASRVGAFPLNCWGAPSPEEELVHHSQRKGSDACCPMHNGEGAAFTAEEIAQFEEWINR